MAINRPTRHPVSTSPLAFMCNAIEAVVRRWHAPARADASTPAGAVDAAKEEGQDPELIRVTTTSGRDIFVREHELAKAIVEDRDGTNGRTDGG